MSSGYNQSDRQQSARTSTGHAYDYNGDIQSLCIANGGSSSNEFNGNLISFINNQLGTSYTEINGAMAAFAGNTITDKNWNELGTFSLGSPGDLLKEDGSYILLENGGKIIL